MPLLTIGNTDIPYQVRYSTKTVHKRIVVTPGGVEVVTPPGTPQEGKDGLLAFLERKRRWVFDSVREIEEKYRKLLTQRYASGAKLQYRGRWLMLDVQPALVAQVEIACRSKFQVLIPRKLTEGERLQAIREAFDIWLKERALRDLGRFVRRHQATLRVKASGFQLSEARGRWGSCGKDRIIRVHWRLIQAPAAAMEYVVAHEVTHLLHRNHGPEFWEELGRTMPDWQERKQMLADWEVDHRAV